MATYRDLLEYVVNNNDARVTDIATALGLPDYVVVRIVEKLEHPYHLVLLLPGAGPLARVHTEHAAVDVALTAARNAGIELDERLK